MAEETKDEAEHAKDEAEDTDHEAEDTKDKAVKDLVRYLVKRYPYPRNWALDMSVFFKALAVNHWKISPLIERIVESMGGSTDRSHDYPIGLMKVLGHFSTDPHLQDVIVEVANTAREQGVDVVNFPSSDEDRDETSDYEEIPVVKEDLDDNTSVSFKTNDAYMVRKREDSALRTLTLNAEGPVSVTITVQKKADATASVNDNGDAKSEGSESA